ncbi:Mitochondrial Rho GTPase [Phytophthora palmivora]|uniref:Mitochondrial Rho GTPase n=1 Tax=Phytophthora palmivora TaxID=4796 RepID=A0A2P4YH77_9STRA|nr:Mitochondrial Rho GTPase [Phytophthora palmivora]
MVDGKPTMSLAVWLACWSFVAQENPQKLLETLFYLGYNDKLSPAIEFVNLTRKATRIERNVVSCYIFGSPESGKEHFVRTFVGGKDAVSADDDQFILRGIGAITEALSDDEIEFKADVLLLVLNPDDETSKMFVEELDKKLPATIPRVVISYKPEAHDEEVGGADESSALVKEEHADFAIDAMLKQYPTALKCYEAHRVKDEAIRVLVATALRPPNNARSKSSGIWLPGRKTGMGVIGLTAAAAVVAFVAKPEESKAVVNDLVSKLRR